MVRREMNRKRSVVLVLVLLAHVAFIAIALLPKKIESGRRRSDAAPLLLLYLPPPERPTVAATSSVSHRARERAALREAPRASSAAADSASPPPEALTVVPDVDWFGQQEQVAKAQSEAILKALRRSCDEAARRGEIRPECRKYKKPDAWEPEPRKFGIEGGLPYMRLGKRCVVGLGFFGCAVGQLPEANGHLLDDMRNPDRPHSSVPDPNNPDD